MIKNLFDKVLIISPHADDEVIGCGGLIKKVINNGGEVHIAITAVGDIKFHHLGRVVTKEERKAELSQALDYLGVTSYVTLFDGYESLLDTIPVREVITVFDGLIAAIKPSAVFIPYPSFHQDHKVVFNASFAALRPSPEMYSFLRLVASYEYPLATWSAETLTGGSIYIDISEELEYKLEAFRKHCSQMRSERHLISTNAIRLLAQKRGLESGTAYAEMFTLLRMYD